MYTVHPVCFAKSGATATNISYVHVGGTGALAVQIANKNPDSEVVSFDLQEVTAAAHNFHQKTPQNMTFHEGK